MLKMCIQSNKKKLKDVDISCLLSDDDMQGRNDMITGSQNDWREGGLSRKRKIFVSQNLCLYYIYLYGLGCTHKNVRFRSPDRLTTQSEKSPDLVVGWSAFSLLGLPS